MAVMATMVELVAADVLAHLLLEPFNSSRSRVDQQFRKWKSQSEEESILRLPPRDSPNPTLRHKSPLSSPLPWSSKTLARSRINMNPSGQFLKCKTLFQINLVWRQTEQIFSKWFTFCPLLAAKHALHLNSNWWANSRRKSPGQIFGVAPYYK